MGVPYFLEREGNVKSKWVSLTFIWPPPPPKPNKEAIKALLKAGQEVPGARLVQGVRVEIK